MLKGLPPMSKPNKPGYDGNFRCAFYDNSEGHTTENGRVFNLRVQELIDWKIPSFADVLNMGKIICLNMVVHTPMLYKV